jgi:hypothetical protein
MAHLLSLYNICCGTKRFEAESVREEIAVVLPDYHPYIPNDDRPQGAMHPTNPRILKTIPRECAPLAQRAGFQIIYADDLDGFDPDIFIQQRARAALHNLRQDGIQPTMSAEELHKLTRGE